MTPEEILKVEKEIVEALPAEMERLGIERLSDIIGIVE